MNVPLVFFSVVEEVDCVTILSSTTLFLDAFSFLSFAISSITDLNSQQRQQSTQINEASWIQETASIMNFD